MPEWILVRRLKQEAAAIMERVRWYLQKEGRVEPTGAVNGDPDDAVSGRGDSDDG